MFHVGQQVVCVNNERMTSVVGGGNAAPASNYLVVGRLYVVRWVGECPYEPWRKHGLNLRLENVVRPENDRRPEWSDFPFCASRFRPIVERKTDISIFTAMLNPSKVSERA